MSNLLSIQHNQTQRRAGIAKCHGLGADFNVSSEAANATVNPKYRASPIWPLVETLNHLMLELLD
jgi:hypothetical protein